MGDPASGVNQKSRNFIPGLVLFLIAPFVGEVLPGARSILSMLNPLNFLVLTTLYGCGAVIIREAAVRWNKGWPTIFLLGLAYGIVEEGIGTQSFANPAWAGLSVPALYGRAFGVNWVWIPQIMLYHSLISMSLSILLVGFLFPEKRGIPYVSMKALRISVVVITLNLAFEVFVLFHYNAGPVYYIAALLSITLLTVMAKKVPPRIRTSRRIVLSGWSISIVAVVFSLTFFAVLGSYIPAVAPSIVDLAATLVLAILIISFLIFVKSRENKETLYYVSVGTIAYFAITAVIFDPVDVVSSVFFILLMVLARIRLRNWKSTMADNPAG